MHSTTKLLCLFTLLLIGISAYAASPILTLLPPSKAVAPGSEIIITLLASNEADTNISFSPPDRLKAILRQGSRAWAVDLKAVRPGAAPIPPHGFARIDYTATLPGAARGRLILEIGPGLDHPLLALITATQPDSAEAAAATSATIRTAYTMQSLSTQPAVALLAEGFIDHISANDPVYFVYGPKAPAAKFQISLKYRLLSFYPEENAQYDSTVQFGYTQRSLWDVNAHPGAFYDTSYMPSVFYQFLSPSPNPMPGSTEITWLGFASGYQHESNGQGGTMERSINTLYARSGVLFGLTDHWHAVVSARAFTYIEGISNNPEIKDYRGYGDWGITIGDGGGPSLAYTGRAGKEFNHATSQFDLNIPVSVKFLDFQIFILMQYFDGYGESLREYEAHSNIVRAGISLVR